MDCPKFNEGDSIAEYMVKVQEYHDSLKRGKYNEILKFVNELLIYTNKEFSSLTKVQNIPKSYFKKNLIHCCNTIKKFRQLIESSIKDDISDIFDENDNRIIGCDYIIYCLTRLIKSVDCTLTKKDINGEQNYSIKIRK